MASVVTVVAGLEASCLLPAPKTNVSGLHAWFLGQALAEIPFCDLKLTMWICPLLCFVATSVTIKK